MLFFSWLGNPSDDVNTPKTSEPLRFRTSFTTTVSVAAGREAAGAVAAELTARPVPLFAPLLSWHPGPAKSAITPVSAIAPAKVVIHRFLNVRVNRLSLL